MLYLLAAIGALTIAVMLWRVLGAERVGAQSRQQGPVAPDDDPDFLRSLGDQPKRQDDDDK